MSKRGIQDVDEHFQEGDVSKRRQLSLPTLDGISDESNMLASTTDNSTPPDQTKPISHAPENLEMAKETEVGISLFVSPSPSQKSRFAGVLKKRYTDFLVNEILLDQTVLHLQSLKPSENSDSKPEPIPQQTAKAQQSNTRNGSVEDENVTGNGGEKLEPPLDPSQKGEAANSSNTPPNTINSDDHSALLTYFAEETITKLQEMFISIQAGNRKMDPITTSITSDRTQRGQMHATVRKIFNGQIDTSTDDKSMLSAYPAGPSRQGARQPRQRQQDTRAKQKKEDYLHFTLYKENKDTMEVVSFLSHQLRLKPKMLQFAGTKDRRAVTVQRISVYRVDANRLAQCNRSLRGSAVGDFSYQKNGLELGRDCAGNEFTISLRDCYIPTGEGLKDEPRLADAEQIVKEAMTSLEQDGFLNYFGMQRFGTFSTRTDSIGKLMLQGDFKAALEAILSYSIDTATESQSSGPGDRTSRDDRFRAEALHLFTTRSLTGSLDRELQNSIFEKLPRKFSSESSIINHLLRNPTDHLGALMTITRNMRSMYLHAYQSLVWNEAVNERWRLYGNKVVEGDLVLIEEHKDKETATFNGSAVAIDEAGEYVIEPNATDNDHADPSDPFAHSRARALTASEASSGLYTIHDVVLPQPGYDVIYPPAPNALGQWYIDFMASERGGGLDPNNMRRKQRDMSLSGGYRKILARIAGGWEVQAREYGDGPDGEDEQFVETDLERVRREMGFQHSDNRPRKDDPRQRNGTRHADHAPEEKVLIPVESTESVDAVKDTTDEVAKADDPKKDEDTAMEGIDKKVPESEEQAKKKLAVILKFQLGTSMYATVALRELSRGGIASYKPEFSGGR